MKTHLYFFSTFAPLSTKAGLPGLVPSVESVSTLTPLPNGLPLLESTVFFTLCTGSGRVEFLTDLKEVLSQLLISDISRNSRLTGKDSLATKAEGQEYSSSDLDQTTTHPYSSTTTVRASLAAKAKQGHNREIHHHCAARTP